MGTKFFRGALGLLIGVNALCFSGWAQAEEPESGWQFTSTPYVWLPNISGSFNFSTPTGTGGQPQVNLGPSDYLSSLNFGFMTLGEARKGDWSIFTDIIYLGASGETARVILVTDPGGVIEIPVDVGTTIGFRNIVWALAVGHTVARNDSSSLDFFAGFRYVRARVKINWMFAGPLDFFPATGTFAQHVNVLDAIVGFRGKVGLGGKWYATYYFDVGGGSSDLTYQGVIGIAHQFTWGDVRIAYRHLHYGGDSEALIDNLTLSGPAVGATLRF